MLQIHKTVHCRKDHKRISTKKNIKFYENASNSHYQDGLFMPAKSKLSTHAPSESEEEYEVVAVSEDPAPDNKFTVNICS